MERHEYTGEELRSWLRDDVQYKAPEQVAPPQRSYVMVYAVTLPVVVIVCVLIAIASAR